MLDENTEQVTPLGRSWSSIDYGSLVTMDPFEFQTRDGATVYGYITKSKLGNSSDAPTIVHPHGGPDGVQDV